MSDYTVPPEIRAFKPKGTIVKRIHQKYYYVYEHFNKKDEDGKWKTKTGKLLGYIDIEKGFVSNKHFITSEEITTYEYGQYAVVINNSKETLNKLLTIFNPKDAYTIYLLASIYFTNTFVPLKDVEIYFEQSYISLIHKDISLSYYTISKLLDDLGRKQTKVFEFEQLLIDNCSKEIAIDGHDIRSCSHDNDLAEIGNKFSSMRDMQLNVLMAYDINTEIPLLSRTYAGSILDKSSVSDLLDFDSLYDMLFIIDRGFYSQDNLKKFSQNNNRYIIPLAMNLTSYKEITKDMNFHDIFIYEKSKKTSPIEYKSVILEDQTKIIVYRDLVQNAKDNVDYLKNIELYPEKYTNQKHNEIKSFFGVIVLQTNLDKDVKEIYELYKKRWRIETFFNYFKNGVDINALGINGYYSTQGLSFIMLIVGLIYRELRNATKGIKGKSIDDCLLAARFLKLNHRKNSFTPSVCKKQTIDLLTNLNVSLSSPVK